MRTPWLLPFLCLAALLAGVSARAQAPAPVIGEAVTAAPAQRWKEPEKLVLFDIARAGSRIVAVGEMGVVLLSDDEGKTFRQAKSVPADGGLNALAFADERHGWAVGHWGLILATEDGGETWSRQRIDTSVDQPLFSVLFRDAREGWAVGLWSLILHTTDGGRTWETIRVEPPKGAKKADKNLFDIFADRAGTLYVAAEQGNVLRSRDGGRNWSYLPTGYLGSFWTGIVAADGTILVGGLRGNLYRSVDGGANWKPVPTGTKLSITSLAQAGDEIVGIGLDGLVISGKARDREFTAQQLPDRATLTALVQGKDRRWIMSSKSGIVVRQ